MRINVYVGVFDMPLVLMCWCEACEEQQKKEKDKDIAPVLRTGGQQDSDYRQGGRETRCPSVDFKIDG